ncbi:FkbM family methyltransferase [Laspinema olomoucense]|uniref:FkbM family methyltransferase n=1 Tax=Laspinema olomoucense TaxID=3231600 RepID=UPI0021BB42F7|nr:FkbM family methyltransferase [Laspinema sp. D3a]MCT7989222.1 FkbM family methyltransferase [Laspinema sp. D3a]
MSVFVASLKKSGHLDRIYMTLCNVGSRKVSPEDDYGNLGWSIFAPNLSIYGFDADADACDEANADLEYRQVNWNENHIPLALGKSVGEATLYVTKNPMCSSLYLPKESYLQLFNQLPEVASLDFSIEIETTTLDSFCQSEAIEEIDFISLDVQGAELEVLEGASQIVSKSVLAVQAEVWFSEVYVNQPLFAEVDNYLRSQGFTLFTLKAGCRSRARSPITSTANFGQLLWGDAFYLRDLLQEDITTPLKTPEKLFKLACLADMLDFPDFSLQLLEHLTLHYGRNDSSYNFANNIVESLVQLPDLVNQGLDSLPIIKNIRDDITGDWLDLLEGRKSL